MYSVCLLPDRKIEVEDKLFRYKKCSICNNIKFTSEFHLDKKREIFNSDCKICHSHPIFNPEKTRFTQKQIDEICLDYQNFNITVQEITKKFSIGTAYLIAILKFNNIERREDKKYLKEKQILIGLKQDSLTILNIVNKNRTWLAHCRCDCGKELLLRIRNKKLVNKSCGCKKVKQMREVHTRHGDSSKRLYKTWSSMKSRCYYDRKSHKSWFGKGIKVCDEWLNNYPAFKLWALANGYKEGLSIDRVNPDKNYCPENCEWVTVSENTRRMLLYKDNLIKQLKFENQQLKEEMIILKQQLSVNNLV